MDAVSSSRAASASGVVLGCTRTRGERPGKREEEKRRRERDGERERDSPTISEIHSLL